MFFYILWVFGVDYKCSGDMFMIVYLIFDDFWYFFIFEIIEFNKDDFLKLSL